MRSLASAFAVATCAIGCASWPQPRAIASHSLQRAAIGTIDILPADIEVWTSPEATKDATTIRSEVEARMLAATAVGIHRRGYRVGSTIGWDGTFVASPGAPASPALGPAELLATLDSLATFGRAVNARGPVAKTLPAPFLPHRLGGHTGSDATLYLGGWGFAGSHPSQVSAGAVIGAAVVIGMIVVAIAAADASSSSSSTSSRARSKTRDHRAANRAAGGDRSTLSTVGHAVGNAVTSGASALGRAAASVGRVALESPDLVVDLVDAFGRTDTHRSYGYGRPDYAHDPSLPSEGESAIYVEMTLVDNRTGVALWHAHERVPADPADPADVTRAIDAMLATLPTASNAVAAR